MGRARRNQRDNRRKSRAKRRSRGKNTSDDESSGDDYALPRIQHVAKKAKTSTAATADINHQKTEEHESSITAPAIKEPSDNKSEAITTEEHGAAPIKTEEDKKETPKKLDRIERLRLKKQQQKARRKEKKAAREAAQSK